MELLAIIRSKDITNLIVVALIVFPIWGYLTKCPSCNKWFARKKNGDKKLRGYEEGYDIAEREDAVYRDSKGNITGSRFIKEKVEVIHKMYDVHWKCSKCNHQWTTTDREKAE